MSGTRYTKTERKKILAAYRKAVKAGHGSVYAAEIAGVHYQTIRRWIREK